MELQNSITTLKALADASRLMILNGLLEKPQYVEELSERFNLAASTVSFHLKKLERANLVIKNKEQYYTVFQANGEILDQSLRKLITFKNIHALVEQERIEKYKNKVLQTFMPNGILMKIPAQYKKRLIIYQFFLDKLEPGKKYTEKEINALILPHFDDYCNIRRAMVDSGMIHREGQIYWRLP